MSFLFVFFLTILLISIALLLSRHRRKADVYLVDFSCLRPPPGCRIPIATFAENLSLIQCFDKESIDFMVKAVKSSGIGEETCFPPSLIYIPPKIQFQESIREVHMLLFPVMDDLFAKSKVGPLDIDVLIVNCSGLCTSPSLSAILVNHYSMRQDIKTFNLSGMGCSASAIAVDIATSLLSLRPNKTSHGYAVVLSTEILSTGWYSGKDREKLILNCSFRMGSAALLLTNRDPKETNPKYKFCKLVRTQHASDQLAYKSAFREEDSQGITGFSLQRNLLKVAADILKDNVFTLGAAILPVHTKLAYIFHNIIAKTPLSSSSSYLPNFGSVIQHYCVPASGLSVIKEIARGLGLTETDMEPGMATFHRFGNQSSSSMWYQLAYMEAKNRVKKGDRVWQLGMGSGPKCNTLVWECIKEKVTKTDSDRSQGPWDHCIRRYPISHNKQ